MLWGLLSTGWSRIPSAALPDQFRRLFELESRIGAKQALLREQFAQPAGKRNTAQVDSLQRELKSADTAMLHRAPESLFAMANSAAGRPAAAAPSQDDPMKRQLRAGTSAPVAFQQAKRQVLKQRLRLGNIDVSLAHPFFWAPFILVGAPAGR